MFLEIISDAKNLNFKLNELVIFLVEKLWWINSKWKPLTGADPLTGSLLGVLWLTRIGTEDEYTGGLTIL